MSEPITDPELAAMRYLCKTSLERAVIPVGDLSRLLREVEEVRAALRGLLNCKVDGRHRLEDWHGDLVEVQIARAALGKPRCCG